MTSLRDREKREKETESCKARQSMSGIHAMWLVLRQALISDNIWRAHYDLIKLAKVIILFVSTNTLCVPRNVTF